MNKKGIKTREHIRKCAGLLFAEKGFKEVTMKDICEASGLSRGGLYGHYGSTRQIFQEIIDDMARQQDRALERRMDENQPAAAILDDILEHYKNEMLDSRSSLSLAICEYFSLPGTADSLSTLYEQYLISANTWKKLIQYGIDRQEFHEVDIAAVFHLIVFSYQGVRMYSRLMPVGPEIPCGILQEIRKILVKE